MERNDLPQTRRRRVNQPTIKTPAAISPTALATSPARTQDKLADVGSSVRERAGSLKDSLADALETGANKLRRPVQGDLAGSTASGSIAVESDSRLADVSTNVAGGMQKTASWLRDADIDGLKTGIERQVKEHPARSLFIAIGVGYLIGKAFRR